MKNKISVCYLSDFCFNSFNTFQDKLKLLEDSLQLEKLKEKGIEFEWNEEKPEILFVNESIYYGRNQKKIKNIFNKIVFKYNPILIYVSSECIEPDFNIFDYAIVLDRNLSLNNRCVRYPLGIRTKDINYTNKIITMDMAKNELENKSSFCNFIYSNGKAHPMRERLFFKINEYKKLLHLENILEILK